jgi:hypothetical protein
VMNAAGIFSGPWTSSLSYCGSPNRERQDSPDNGTCCDPQYAAHVGKSETLVHALRDVVPAVLFEGKKCE